MLAKFKLCMALSCMPRLLSHHGLIAAMFEAHVASSLIHHHHHHRQYGQPLRAKMPATLPTRPTGRGLFLTGEAAPGSVLAILPGVVYQRTQLNKMPNYPKV